MSTLAEVAKVAGVSIATASRVLNGENKEIWAGPAARAEKIRRTATKLGYRPDWRAKSLRGGRSNTIGVVYTQVHPMMDPTSYMLMFRSFGEMLEPAGYHMLFVHVPRGGENGLMPASILQAVDAAMFYHRFGEGEQEAARIVRGPAVLVNCKPQEGIQMPVVRPDEAGGAKALAEHLLSLGHRRILFIDLCRPGADFDHYSRIVRQNTISQVMEEAGFGAGFMRWEADVSIPYSELVARYKAMSPEERPTAIVISYSINALSLMNEMLRQGVRVPEDVSFATFDDHDIIAQALVPMTTVEVPMDEIGRASARLLLNMLETGAGGTKGYGTQTILLQERLIARKSTAPVAPRYGAVSGR